MVKSPEEQYRVTVSSSQKHKRMTDATNITQDGPDGKLSKEEGRRPIGQRSVGRKHPLGKDVDKLSCRDDLLNRRVIFVYGFLIGY